MLVVVSPDRACAQASPEVEAIRKEMEQLRREYEQRLRAMEERLRQIEARPSGPVMMAPTNAVSAGGQAAAPEVVPLATTAQQGTEAPAGVVVEVPPSTAAILGLTNANGPTVVAALPSRGRNQSRFRRDTESRQRSLSLEQEAAIRERVEHVLEDFVEITGYFRAGYGRNEHGGTQVAFQAPGSFAKYRLGNEAEVYGELGFAKNFYVPSLFSLDPKDRWDATSTGAVARVQILMSMYNPYEDILSASSTDFGLPEAWASIGNIVAFQPSAQVWAGNRFYRRHDIHINDFFFYNMSGTGGGIEDVELPFGKAAIAWIGAGSRSGFSDIPDPDPQNQAGFSKGNLDLRVYDVPVPFGRGEFGFVYAQEDSGRDALGNSAPDSEGFAFTALHAREKFISADGINKFSLQYGMGAAKTFTSGFERLALPNGVFINPDARNSWRFRATEHFTANLNDHFSIGPALLYQFTDYGDRGGIVHWSSAGVRPIVHFNKYLSLAFEGGIDWVRDEEAGTSDHLYKLTLAPQVSLGSRFMSRPVIRAYVTYAGWGDDFVGRVGGNDYIEDDEAWVYGVQMEVWW